MKKIKKCALPCICVAIVSLSIFNYFYERDEEIHITYADTNTESPLTSVVSSDLESINITGDAVKIDSSAGRINLNTADEVLLQTVKGIGPKKAEAIVKYRNTYGGFSCVEELTEVSGIGEKTLEKIKDYFYVE